MLYLTLAYWYYNKYQHIFPPKLRDFPQLVTERRNVLLLKNKCDEQALKCVNIASVALMFRY